MMNEPYGQFSPEKLILRDHLAIDRTFLANERTFLGYVRTALTLFVAGIGFIKIINDRLIEMIGWLFIPLAVVVLLAGWRNYRKRKRLINQVYEAGKAGLDPLPHDPGGPSQSIS